jgi:cation diffusion facilitator family transporter
MKMKFDHMANTRCTQCAIQIGWVSFWINLILVLLKITVGIIGGSKACIADGLHSASNVVVAVAIIMSQKISSRQKNSGYHYGFGKIEFLLTGFISFFIISGALALLFLSIKHLVSEPVVSPPHLSAALMAMISIGTTEMLFRYMRCAGVRVNSQIILAGAWANRANCFSSVAVLVGVISAKMGYHYLDPVTAILVVGIIINACYKMLIDSVRALMDYSVNDRYKEEIAGIISEMPDIQSATNIKTRQIGQRIWVELDILVDPGCSILEAQKTGEKVQARLMEGSGDFERVFVNLCPLESE